MPYRSAATPAILSFQRFFRTTSIRRTNTTTHYDTLQVPNSASASDIKKSFYRLSKTHHPDHNPNDPNASTRFVKISEAYAVLGHPEKRKRYDHDNKRTSPGRSHSYETPKGSYHSSGPAGGRPASGLSRRRTHFRGPPPSFYRSGGWGTQEAKRQAAQEKDPSGAYSRSETRQYEAMGGGMGPGQRPFRHGDDVPHFDREGHFRTQANHERRRQKRTSENYIPAGPGSSTLANFIFVSSIILLGVFVPPYIFERLRRKNHLEK